ncbi:MAG: conjugal transfer protein TraG N-terminal domain-containing protein [Sterolibacteriaceae bacterium]|uniref:Conjugal transfer protein TraG N-terminal domain-containing protein n=1 Tax=Candidatus Methylophosphatis roskildensis TaxID=2899263 RepID=A0A9D7DYI0_9PROT|nr:conjugal transfer protein TraG N-terminal domain-containing protein [Candidatus Methylophosphatis roskildensis]
MYEIFAYQNAESLAGIFNAIAAIIGSGDYAGAIALVGVFGFMAALIAYAFAPERLQGWKWLATVVIVYSILYLPRVTVQITDKTSGNPASVVANVPLGIALFGSMTSQVGNVLTSLFETAFQVLPGPGALPSELSYQQNGLMFGSRLVKYSRNIGFVNPAFRTDLIAFIDNCTKFDLMDGTIDPAVFSSSPNIWTLMATPNPARLTPINTAPGVSTIVTCPVAYPILNARALVEVGGIQTKLGQQLNPTLTAAAASAAIGNQITVAYQKNRLAAAASSASDIILQNAMINAVNDTSSMIGQRTNDPASLLLSMGRAQAVAQINASWTNYGKVAEEALPLIRNVIEAICYALFPFVILLLFLTSGMQTMIALKSYVLTLFWIQLWPPVYAILNYMASIATASKLAAAADVGGGTAMSLQTASSIYSNAISLEAVVGYMCISVPAIAWAALKGMETIGQAALTGTSSIQGTVGAASSQAAIGNASMGNLSFEQQSLGPNRTSAFMRTMQNDRTGNTHSTNAFGREAVSLLSNSGFASRIVSRSVVSAAVTEANKAVEAARSDAVSANAERAAALTSIFERGASRGSSWRDSAGSGTSGYEEIGASFDRAAQTATTISNDLGVSSGQVASVAIRAGLAVGGAGLTGGKTFLDGLNESDKKIFNSLSQDNVSDFKRFGDKATHDQQFVRALAGDQNEADRLSAQLADRTSRAQRAEAAFNDRVGMAEKISQSDTHGETIAFDIARDPFHSPMMLQYARDYGGNSAAFYVMADAEIARSGLPPNRTFSDGGAVPQSFRDVQERHRLNSASPELNPDVDSRNAQNRARVAGERFSSGGGSPPPASGSQTRAEVQAAGAQIKGEVSSAIGGFETQHQLSRDAKGNLRTERSQVLDALGAADQDDQLQTEQVKQKIDGFVDEVIADPGAAFKKHAVEPAQNAWDATFGRKK